MSSLMQHLRHPSIAEFLKHRRPVRNVNEEQEKSLSVLDRMALVITERVGKMGFFLLIFAWTIVWCGYNILASDVPALHWKAFDPFPAFVAYLLMSNVIQILLMPLIMVGQNLQGRHADLRAQNDFEINTKAEQEVELILRHLEFQNALLISLVEKHGISREECLASLQKHGLPAEAS